MAELVYAHALGACDFGHKGSSPFLPTKTELDGFSLLRHFFYEDIRSNYRNIFIYRRRNFNVYFLADGKGHFSGSDGVTELPSVLNAIA